ncbi:hypothetical protein GQX73_g4765 [Xylaria multiplex]|uniref:OTU domain-containing protein n=1 Tax=Xylaria multiplex TaxID=323545 RepID=A0A7C8MYQ1_9PEZI|nr:hypothetical protein GQX73_g4765 [Xylaria multiplex]
MEHDANGTGSTVNSGQLPVITDYGPQSPLFEPITGIKRDFGSTFPCFSPNRGVKRFRSNSPVCPAESQCENNNEALDGNAITIDKFPNGETRGFEFCKTEQVQLMSPLHSVFQRTSGTKSNELDANETPHPNNVEHTSEGSLNGTRLYIEIIKQNCPNTSIDPDTTKCFINDIMNIMALNNLATPEEIARIRDIFFPSDTAPTLRVKLGVDQVVSQTSTSPTRSLLPPSFRSTIALPTTVASSKLQNKSTQTQPTEFHPHTDVPGVPVTRRHPLSDIELWARELESVRRPQPLIAGTYTTVNVPLRETIGRPKLSSNGVTTSPFNGTNNNHKHIPQPRFVPSLTSCSGTIINHDYARERGDVIDLVESSDDDSNAVPTHSSRFVGGGNLIYAEHRVGCDPGGYDIEKPIRGQEYRFNWDSRSVDDLDNYELDETDENNQNETDIYSSQSMDSMRRYGNHDNIDYQDGNGQNEPHCAEQHYSCGSPTRAQRGGLYNTRRIGVGGNYLVQPHQENPHNHAGKRYIRDEPETPSFYGYNVDARSTNEADRALRYQDRFNDVGEIPGPKSGLRLNLDKYTHDIGSDVMGLERHINRVIRKTFYASETLDEEQALQEGWTNQPTKLFKGFPLVEEVGFVAFSNQAKPQGDCYWRALAYILHGKSARWDIIKADHYVYLQHVLGDKTHPRHQLYAKLNTQFFQTHGGVLRNNTRTFPFKANIWQLLHLPHSWAPGAMQQITADLYNIHLITFTYDETTNMCSEVSVRGAYNSRHVFMIFLNNCHFQPLAVNEYLSWLVPWRLLKPL